MSKYKPIKLQEFQTTAMSLTTIIDIDYRLDTVDIRAYPTDRHDIIIITKILTFVLR